MHKELKKRTRRAKSETKGVRAANTKFAYANRTDEAQNVRANTSHFRSNNKTTLNTAILKSVDQTQEQNEYKKRARERERESSVTKS
jgi:hypothetical protein